MKQYICIFLFFLLYGYLGVVFSQESGTGLGHDIFSGESNGIEEESFFYFSGSVVDIGSGTQEENILGAFSGQDIPFLSGLAGTGENAIEIATTGTTLVYEELGENRAYGDVYIEEINPHDTDTYGEYIKISSLVGYSGSLVIGGAGQGSTDKEIVVDILPGESLFITDKLLDIDTSQSYILIPSLTLTNSGEELSLLDDTMFLLDKVVYTPITKGSVLVFFESTSEERVFSTPGSPTILLQNNTNSNNQEEEQNSNTQDNPEVVSLQEPKVYITEVHAQDTDLFPEYIELYFKESYAGEITIEGLGNGKTKKSFLIDAAVKDRVVVTDKPGSFITDTKVVELPSISLTDSGEELRVYRQGGQHIDDLVYTSTNNGKSLYFSTFSGDVRIFSSSLPATPGISEQHLSYLNSQIETVSESNACKEKKPSTYYEGLYRKRKKRFVTLKSDVRSLGYAVTTSGNVLDGVSKIEKEVVSVGFVTTTGFLIIDSVLPNPSGKDQGNEELVIKNNYTETVNLAGYSLYNGRTKHGLPGLDIRAGETVSIKESLGLVNKPACISLWIDGKHSSPFCYPTATDDAWFYKSLPFSTNDNIVDTNEMLKKISLEVFDEKTCIYNDGYELVCNEHAYSISDTKARKKEAKKIISLGKKLEEQIQRAESRKEKYHQQIAVKNKIVYESKTAQKLLREEKNQAKKNVRLHENFSYLLLSTLQEDRSGLFYNSNLVIYKDAYNKLKKSLASGNRVSDYYGIPLFSEDIDSFISLGTQRIIPLENQEVGGVLQELIKNTHIHIDTLSKNLKHQRVQ